MFYFWAAEVGRRRHIHSIPRDYHEFERFNAEYEWRHFRHTEANRRVGTATREMFASWFRNVSRPLVRHVIHAILDDKLIEVFGFPRPPRIIRKLVASALRMRARLSGWLPPRKEPRLARSCLTAAMPQDTRLDGSALCTSSRGGENRRTTPGSIVDGSS